jgi:hypothetical protein
MKLDVTRPSLSVAERDLYRPSATANVTEASSHDKLGSAASTGLYQCVACCDSGVDGSGERGLPKIAVGVLYDIGHFG